MLSVDTLATVVLGRIEQDADGAYALRWTNAGHPPPLLLHAEGWVEVLETRAEMLVGVRPGAARTDHVTPLPTGSTLLLYTDGLIEQRDGDRDIDSGTARLVESLTGRAELPLDALLDRVLERAVEPREDDIVVLAVRIAAAGPQERQAAAHDHT
jgi:serine phosphatase RsbU (regulator of sigma subunit)